MTKKIGLKEKKSQKRVTQMEKNKKVLKKKRRNKKESMIKRER